jgi:membrane-associated phospholipid phosphatase
MIDIGSRLPPHGLEPGELGASGEGAPNVTGDRRVAGRKSPSTRRLGQESWLGRTITVSPGRHHPRRSVRGGAQHHPCADHRKGSQSARPSLSTMDRRAGDGWGGGRLVASRAHAAPYRMPVVRTQRRWPGYGEPPRRGDRLSDLSLSLAIAVPIGVLAVSHDDFDKGFGRDVLIVCEATTISGALTQGAKYALRRERPWAHFADAPPGEELGSAGSNLSFFSGHASTAFAVVASSGAIASMRGDRAAPWIWGTGLGLAATTGYLRIAADRHYLTDVVAGAVVGTAVGLAVPHLLHKKQGAPSIQVPPALEPSAMLAGMAVRSRASGRTGMTVGAGIRHGGPVFTASWTW